MYWALLGLTSRHRSSGPGNAGAVPASDGALDFGDAGGLEWSVAAGMGGKMAWAGPSHWRFKAPPKPPGADSEKAKPNARKEKGALTFDFENPGRAVQADSRLNLG